MRVAVSGATAVAVIVAIWAGALSNGIVFVISGLLAAIIPIALVRGLWRLVRQHGMTLQSVAGALAIYLLVGLLFAWAVGFVATLDSDQFFANGHNAVGGSIVYYSFTVLTTTGFGDYTAATPRARRSRSWRCSSASSIWSRSSGCSWAGLPGARRVESPHAGADGPGRCQHLDGGGVEVDLDVLGDVDHGRAGQLVVEALAPFVEEDGRVPCHQRYRGQHHSHRAHQGAVKPWPPAAVRDPEVHDPHSRGLAHQRPEGHEVLPRGSATRRR